MTTKKQSATAKSKKASVKRSAAKGAKKPSSKSVSAKLLAKNQAVLSRDPEKGTVVIHIKPGSKLKLDPQWRERLTTLKHTALPLVDSTKLDDASKPNPKKGAKKKAATPGGASSTAPVVYQTLRERVAAVEKNIGQKQTLKEFLDSVGWK